MEQIDADLKALEDFIVGNAELEKLEAMLDKFNIFEAVGMVTQEVRHSRFLSFLLDPNQPHGLGDAFANRLLQRVVIDLPDMSACITPSEMSSWNLGGMQVRREWHRIDIFLLDERKKLAVIIENKIWSREHGDQLSRYYEAVREEYPDYRILAIYLTPNGNEPSHSKYLPLDYGTICEMLDEVRKSKSSVMEPDAKVLIKHYTDMMRRNIVGDHNIERLSREIYRKHSRAIDLIMKHQYKSQEDVRNQIWHLCEALVGENENFDHRYSNKNKVALNVRYWKVPDTISSFEFWNQSQNLELKLLIGPGSKETRQRLFQMVREDSKVFVSQPNLGGNWSVAYNLQLLSASFYYNSTDAEREAEIRKNWNDFLKNDLPRIDAALRAEEWIWENVPESAPE